MAFHRNTSVSFFLSAASLGLSAYHYFVHPVFDVRLIASVASLLAFAAAMSEMRKHSSLFQITGIFLSMFTLGISIDWNFLFFPFITASMLVSILSYKKFFRKWYPETDAMWLDIVFVIVSIGLFVCGNIFYSYGWKGWALPVIPIAVNAFFTFSDFMSGITTLKFVKGRRQDIEIGKPAPHFLLPDMDGKTVSLSDYKDKQHVLLVFIRNDWCPSCRINLRTYEQHRNKFNKKKYSVANDQSWQPDRQGYVL